MNSTVVRTLNHGDLGLIPSPQPKLRRLFNQCPPVVLVTHLVIGDLLQKQMGVVLDGHSSVAVVVAVEGRPGEHYWLKRTDPFLTALQTHRPTTLQPYNPTALQPYRHTGTVVFRKPKCIACKYQYHKILFLSNVETWSQFKRKPIVHNTNTRNKIATPLPSTNDLNAIARQRACVLKTRV